MGSEPDDDDARSFGSEPDFAAMSSLRISSGTDAGPSPNGGHVFDELLDDPPRPFDHDLREAEAEQLKARAAYDAGMVLDVAMFEAAVAKAEIDYQKAREEYSLDEAKYNAKMGDVAQE